MAKIYFMGELPKEVRDKRLQEYEFFARQMLQRLQPTEKEISAAVFGEKDYFMMSTFYYSYQVLQNMIRWIEYIKEQKPLSMFLRKEGDS